MVHLLTENAGVLRSSGPSGHHGPAVGEWGSSVRFPGPIAAGAARSAISPITARPAEPAVPAVLAAAPGTSPATKATLVALSAAAPGARSALAHPATGMPPGLGQLRTGRRLHLTRASSSISEVRNWCPGWLRRGLDEQPRYPPLFRRTAPHEFSRVVADQVTVRRDVDDPQYEPRYRGAQRDSGVPIQSDLHAGDRRDRRAGRAADPLPPPRAVPAESSARRRRRRTPR
jgi:hypothetical protein